MKAECRAARRAVLLGHAGSASVREHLEECEGCRAFEVSERSLADLVRRRAAKPPASHSLRERLVSALDAERKRATRGWRRWWTRIAGMVVVAAAVSASGWLYLRQGVAEARRTVAALAADHIGFAQRGGLAELVSSSPDEISEWLRGRTRLALNVPVLPGGTVLGARRCSLRGRPAALVFYRFPVPTGREGGSIASLFVFQSAGEKWSHMETFAGGRSKRICRAHDRGLSVLVWEERGLTYAFVAEIPEPHLLAVAEHL